MKFPLIILTETNWQEEDLMEYTRFDEFVYTDKQPLFDKFLKDKSFCDCDGCIFIVRDRIPPKQWWRKTLKFLPNIYRETLVFEKDQ